MSNSYVNLDPLEQSSYGRKLQLNTVVSNNIQQSRRLRKFSSVTKHDTVDDKVLFFCFLTEQLDLDIQLAGVHR